MLISAINNTELCRLLLAEKQRSLVDFRIQTLVGNDHVQMKWPDGDVLEYFAAHGAIRLVTLGFC
jgi:hypothetical protein